MWWCDKVELQNDWNVVCLSALHTPTADSKSHNFNVWSVGVEIVNKTHKLGNMMEYSMCD